MGTGAGVPTVPVADRAPIPGPEPGACNPGAVPGSQIDDQPTPATSVADPGDETSVVTTAAAAVPPEQVWHALVARTSEWWSDPYLAPAAEPMRLDARLGGRVWSGPDVTDGRQTGSLHGAIRAFDPPERLEIGSVLVPGAYAGSITVTIERTGLGSEVRVEQMARGSVVPTLGGLISPGCPRLPLSGWRPVRKRVVRKLKSWGVE